MGVLVFAGIAVIGFIVFVAIIVPQVESNFGVDVPYFNEESTATIRSIDSEKTAKLIHDLVNEEREKAGLKSLIYDLNLAAIAQAHAVDMTERNYFDHDTPEGIDPTARAQAADYNCRKITHSGIAENLYLQEGGPVLDSLIAADSVKGWMDSAGHRANILSVNYDREGIGVALDDQGNTVKVVQTFC